PPISREPAASADAAVHAARAREAVLNTLRSRRHRGTRVSTSVGLPPAAGASVAPHGTRSASPLSLEGSRRPRASPRITAGSWGARYLLCLRARAEKPSSK